MEFTDLNNHSNTGNLKVIADDLGLAQSVNEGIVSGLRDKWIHGASLMANGEAFFDAVKKIKELPNPNIGVHLILVEEKSLATKKEIPSLVDGQNNFPGNYYNFFIKYILGLIHKKDIEKELSHQIKRCVDAGVQLSFLNSHQHLHLLPGITNIVIDLAKKFDIPHIRVVNEPIIGGRGILRQTQLIFLRLLSKLARRKIIRRGLKTNDIFIGFINAGNLGDGDVILAQQLSVRYPDKVIELNSHPGFENDQLRSKYRHWGKYNWDKEVEVLRKFLKKNG